MQQDQIYKIVTVGEGRVGKSSIITRFVLNDFKTQTEITINASYLEKQIQVNNEQLQLAIWDTAGQEKYRCLSPVYYRNADAAIVVFDMSVKETLDKAERWISELKEFANNDQLVIIVVGNKCDLAHDLDIDSEGIRIINTEIKQLSSKLNAKFFMTSAKNSKGIKDVFNYIGTGNRIFNVELIKIKCRKRRRNTGGLQTTQNKSLVKTSESDRSTCQC